MDVPSVRRRELLGVVASVTVAGCSVRNQSGELAFSVDERDVSVTDRTCERSGGTADVQFDEPATVRLTGAIETGGRDDQLSVSLFSASDEEEGILLEVDTRPATSGGQACDTSATLEYSAHFTLNGPPTTVQVLHAPHSGGSVSVTAARNETASEQ